ncbi:MAG: hypothetical protein IKE03_07780 [Blautia sp.]|nr:hypothetical protein [Blautia sp.]
MKRIHFLLPFVIAVVTASGCGTREAVPDRSTAGTGENTQEAAATPEPVPETLVEDDLVEMQAIPSKDVENTVGATTESSRSIVVENQTGETVSEFYVRLHPEYEDDEEWGWDQIAGAFTVENSQKFIYNYEPSSQEGNTDTRYDVIIRFAREGMDECYYRNLPLDQITTLTLRMYGTGDEAYPYCTYYTTVNTSEVSTLNEVRERLGLSVSEDEDISGSEEDDYTEEDGSSDDSSESQDSSGQSTGTDSNDTTQDQDQSQEQTPDTQTDTDDEVIDTGEIVGESDVDTEDSSRARTYIGQSLEALEADLGSPNGSDYQELVQLGTTGYHYYNSFTVSTAVDDDGNEIVTGVW